MDVLARKAYRSDLTDEQWAVLEPLLPPAKPGGRPRSVNLREVMNTLLYQERTGCQWEYLPHDLLPKSTVYEYFAQWRDDGTWERLVDALRRQVRKVHARSGEAHPSAASIDSQTVKTTDLGGEQGYDGGKKITGRKRHLVVDTLGLMLTVMVTSAALDEAAAAPGVLGDLDAARQPRLRVVWADSKYHNHELNDWLTEYPPAWRLEIVRRPEGAKGFVLLPKRWVVERSFAWLGRYRQHSKDDERRVESSESHIRICAIHGMLRRLHPSAPQAPFRYGFAG